MSPALNCRRRLLLGALVGIGGGMRIGCAAADAAAAAPIQRLCDGLLSVMKAGGATPFQQRYATLEPVIDSVFNLPAILQVSIGPAWPAIPPDQQAALLAAFRRYTIANYVSNFDNYTGQHFNVLPETKSLANGEQVVQTRIVSSSGESHQLDYVMRQDGGAWRAIDVLADGSISRVAVQRSDFRRLLATGGGPALVASLQRKTADLSGGALPGG